MIAEQPAPSPHLALPEGCAALRIALVTVPRVSRSCEIFTGGFDLHLLHLPRTRHQGWNKWTIPDFRFPSWRRRIRLCQPMNGSNPRPGFGPILRAGGGKSLGLSAQPTQGPARVELEKLPVLGPFSWHLCQQRAPKTRAFHSVFGALC